MRILITNDDSIKAAQLIPLVKWAQKLGEVTVYAPQEEQSGKSHSIEIHKPFSVNEMELLPDVRAYAVGSSPADCVRYAILGRKEHFDLVISGINRGYNLGTDIIYSGTIGAASEGAFLGVDAIAVSTDFLYYEHAVEHMDAIWDFFCRNRLLEKHSLYNVNIPPQGWDIRITRQGGPYYSDDFAPGEDGLIHACGHCVYEPGTDLSVDTHCALNGHISITPLSNILTEERLFTELRDTCK